MALPSIYDSVEYEGSKNLKRYRKQLKRINAKHDSVSQLTDDELREKALSFNGNFNIKKTKDVENLYAVAREVCFRLLGKRHYDVQILGALAALERQIIQMSTGSGKTLTLILPAIAYGLTHRGINVLTVNDYLSKRDWEETRIVYDYFGLTNAYVSNNDSPQDQQTKFLMDITYSTNSTLGFAYLNSALASGINADVKPIVRPLHAAIIDEADEILMDDARNPLIIASGVDLGERLSIVEHDGRTFVISEMLDKMRTLTHLDYDSEDGGQTTIGDKTWDEIYDIFQVDGRIFDNPDFIRVIYAIVDAIFKQKAFEDYVVTPEPDSDSGSRVVLIDKATGRLARGRTLNDDLHAFVEMKEGVFTGQGSESSIQITYQVLFNLFPVIAGVTGTVGSSFKEFYDIYRTSVVKIPDRLPNQLKSFTNLFATKPQLMDRLNYYIRIYQSSRHPILIGAASDMEAEMISQDLTNRGVPHKLLISTDNNEDAVIATAGEVGSIVVTTDIMGRGTDIHVQETDYERGLVVLQVGGRPNSRVERQFAGRAARQGEPGRYHRMLALTELKDLGVQQSGITFIMKKVREHKDLIAQYGGDILLDAYAPYYTEVVDLIDEALTASESSTSSSRVSEFRTGAIVDLIQVSLVSDMDKWRSVVKEALEVKDISGVTKALAVLSLPEAHRRKAKLVKSQELLWSQVDQDLQLNTLFNYTEKMIHEVLPRVRAYAESAYKTANLTQMSKMETKPEDYMTMLIKSFMETIEKECLIPLP